MTAPNRRGTDIVPRLLSRLSAGPATRQQLVAELGICESALFRAINRMLSLRLIEGRGYVQQHKGPAAALFGVGRALKEAA